MSSTTKSFLSVVLAADNFPSSPYADPYPAKDPKTGQPYIQFHLTRADYDAKLPPVGLVQREVLTALLGTDDDGEDDDFPWAFGHEHDPKARELGTRVTCIFFADDIVKKGKKAMSVAMQTQAEEWRRQGKFCGPLAGMLSSAIMLSCSASSRGYH